MSRFRGYDASLVALLLLMLLLSVGPTGALLLAGVARAVPHAHPLVSLLRLVSSKEFHFSMREIWCFL